MESEKIPLSPLEKILRDLEESLYTLGLEIYILDEEEESTTIRLNDGLPRNTQLIAVESPKKFTQDTITRAELLVAEKDSSLYKLSFAGEVGDTLGHITIKSKVN